MTDLEQAHLLTLQDQDLRHLTYLELCVVPSLIVPYLSRMSPSQIRSVFWMHLQTVFEQHLDLIQSSSKVVSFEAKIAEIKKKPIGRQMVYLLQSIILHCVKQNHPLHEILYKFEANTEVMVKNFVKGLMEDMMTKGHEKPISSYLSCAGVLLDLAWELHEIRRGNGKIFYNKCPEALAALLHDRRKMMDTVENDLMEIYESDLSTEIRPFCDYATTLLKKCHFVFFERYKKEANNLQKQAIMDQSLQVMPIDLEQSAPAFEINSFYTNQSSLKMKEQFLLNMFLNCLHNYDHIDVEDITMVYNTTTLLLQEIWERYEDLEQLQVRSNIYCMLLSLKMLIYSKKATTLSGWGEFAKEVENSFKEIMEYNVISIRQTWLFLNCFTHMNMENDSVFEKAGSLIVWIMQIFSKQNFKPEDLIYADFIILCKEILEVWKLTSNGERTEEIQKQIDAAEKSLAAQMISTIKKYSEKDFSIFFEVMNMKLLQFTGNIAFKSKISGAVKQAQPKNEAASNPKDLLLTIFQERVNQSLNVLAKQSSSELKTGQDKSVSSQNDDSLALLYHVILHRSQKIESRSMESIIYIRMYKIMRSLKDSWAVVQSKRTLLLSQIQQCLIDCCDVFLSKTNILLTAFTLPNKKGGQTVPIADPPEVKSVNVSLESLYNIAIFLSLLYLSFSPTTNPKFILHALIINSFSNTEIQEQKIISVYNAVCKKPNQKWLKSDEYAPILKFTVRYDVLDCFYEDIFRKEGETRVEWPSLRKEFEQFCREWCNEEDNYQWLSEPKYERIRLNKFKEYCLFLKKSLSLR